MIHRESPKPIVHNLPRRSTRRTIIFRPATGYYHKSSISEGAEFMARTLGDAIFEEWPGNKMYGLTDRPEARQRAKPENRLVVAELSGLFQLPCCIR